MTVLPFVAPGDRIAAFPRVADHLRAGGLLAYPTETVYGVGSRAVAADLAALSALKGRAAGKPFLLLVSSRGMAERVGLFFSPSANALAEACWPGPLTLILPGGGRLPDTLRGSEGGIAVRWTAHQGAADLVAYLDEPLTSTSANRPGGPPAPGVGAILHMFASAVAAGQLLVLDGGVLGNVPASTIVDCTGTKARLVREGALPRAELQARVGRLAP
jgi:L-threonylcarbamoyladenylate synthase